MADWVRPQHSRGAVNGAGVQLADATVLTPYQPMEIINNWRSSHSFPLNTLQNATRRYGRTVDPDVLVAQRIKRLPAITAKLKNEPWLKLSQMQDIGGCRGVVSSVEQVRQLVTAFVDSKMKHELLREDDYITTPRASGYRSHHLVYKYYSDRSDHWNDLRIEVQIRSQLQHAWATAVETVSAFTGQALKASQGDDDWRRFFALMGSEMAIHEGTPLIDNTPPDRRSLVRELKKHAKSLNIVATLTAYRNTIEEIVPAAPRNIRCFLIHRDSTERVQVSGYRDAERGRAYTDYNLVENTTRADPLADVVLVRVESLAALRRAYPNYFLDTEVFLGEVKRVLG